MFMRASSRSPAYDIGVGRHCFAVGQVPRSSPCDRATTATEGGGLGTRGHWCPALPQRRGVERDPLNITTDRLTLVRAKPEDADALFAVLIAQDGLPMPADSAPALRGVLERSGWARSFNPANNIPYSAMASAQVVGWVNVY